MLDIFSMCGLLTSPYYAADPKFCGVLAPSCRLSKAEWESLLSRAGADTAANATVCSKEGVMQLRNSIRWVAATPGTI
jgi:hypothetical protein